MPQLSDLDKCTRCGLCEQACPTYRLWHYEPDSPRGRVFLMKQVADGAAQVDANLAEHLYQCLGCRACETVCPAGVPFGELLEAGRYQVEQRGELAPNRRGWRTFRSIAFERILPSRWVTSTLLWPARIFQKFPAILDSFQWLRLPTKVEHLLRMIPRDWRRSTKAAIVMHHSKPPTAHHSSKIGGARIYPAIGTRRSRVGLFLGCVMRSLLRRVHAATIDVLTKNGCEVVVPENQWCCGALNVHAGEQKMAAAMAARNARAFAPLQLDAIVVNSAGCGAHLKAYSRYGLDGDEATKEFSSKTKDVHEYLCEIGVRPGPRTLPLHVTYQDACHLVHGQGIRNQPRQLLKQIPGLTFVEMRAADQCCGAAGVYNLTHPAASSALLESKLDDIAATRADVVATANPGCAMQLGAGLVHRKMDVGVCHVVELLAASYYAGP